MFLQLKAYLALLTLHNRLNLVCLHQGSLPQPAIGWVFCLIDAIGLEDVLVAYNKNQDSKKQ